MTLYWPSKRWSIIMLTNNLCQEVQATLTIYIGRDGLLQSFCKSKECGFKCWMPHVKQTGGGEGWQTGSTSLIISCVCVIVCLYVCNCVIVCADFNLERKGWHRGGGGTLISACVTLVSAMLRPEVSGFTQVWKSAQLTELLSVLQSNMLSCSPGQRVPWGWMGFGYTQVMHSSKLRHINSNNSE